jgi:triphosphatase
MQEQMLDHQEIEWQFEAAQLAPVESWLKEHPSTPDLTTVPGATKELTDTYYDTEDWRLYRAGYALRVRRDGKGTEATMKSLAPAEDALRRRHEISELLKRGTDAPKRARGPIGELLRRLADDQDLRPLFEVRTRRRSFMLFPERPSESDAAVGEVALDGLEISGLGGARTRLSRVEVEIHSDAELPDAVGELVGERRNALGLRPAGTSKVEAGLSTADLHPRGAPDLGPEEKSERSNKKDGR